MRYAGFKNCVFLIDEIQSLPPRLYTFFTAFLDAFCKKFNSYAVISTATMPKFDLPNDGSTFSKEARELFHDYTTPIEVGNPTHFDNNIFNRYKIIPIQQDLTIAGLVNRVIEEKGSTMVILNTIRSSRDVFNLIKRCNIIPSDKIFLLNTLFCSDDRTAKLEKIKKLLENNEKIILVTTQVIEAGVDIDFNTVYRDIAPLPNIIQSAGRCNRNGKLPFGTVHVFKLIDETNKNMLFARYIYKGLDEVFLNNSMEVFFNSKDEFEEKYLFEYQKNHFNFINQKTVFGNWADNKNFVTQIKSFQYKEIGKFSIINKNMYEDQVQFYIPKDENDNNYEKMIDMYADMKVSEELPDKNHDSMKDILARDQELRAQRKSMQGRVVQCNVKDPLELRELSAYPNESGEPLFKLYKLNLDKYNSEFGILINKGELYV
jgi:CRISPR-associated endonuclease/helicase Cas3